MTVPTRDQATRDARRITLLGTAAVLWVLTWNLVGIWTRRADLPSQWPAAVLVLVESTVALVVGLLVVRRHPRNVVGWLLVAHAMAVALVMSGDEEASGGTLSAWSTQLGQGSWVLLFVFIALIGYVFPTGEFLSRRWRRYVIACLTGHVVFLVAAALDASSFRAANPGVTPPLDVPDPPPALEVLLLVVGARLGAGAAVRCGGLCGRAAAPGRGGGAPAAAVVRLGRDQHPRRLRAVLAGRSRPAPTACCSSSA